MFRFVSLLVSLFVMQTLARVDLASRPARATKPQTIPFPVTKGQGKVVPKYIFSCMRNMRKVMSPYQIRVSQNNSLGSKRCSAQLLNDYETAKALLLRRFQVEGKGWVGFPMTDSEMEMWSDLSDHVPVAVLPRAMIPVVTDKIRFKDFLISLGHAAHVPKRYLSAENVKYPCVLKLDPHRGTGSSGVSIVSDENQLKERLGTVSFDSVLVEEYIDTKVEYSIYVVGLRGEVVSLEECTRIDMEHEQFIIVGSGKGQPIRRTFLKCAELPNWDTVEKVTTDLLRGLNFTGLAFIQLSYDKSNTARFVEMNGRPSGALYFDNQALLALHLSMLNRAGVQTGMWSN